PEAENAKQQSDDDAERPLAQDRRLAESQPAQRQPVRHTRQDGGDQPKHDQPGAEVDRSLVQTPRLLRRSRLLQGLKERQHPEAKAGHVRAVRTQASVAWSSAS